MTDTARELFKDGTKLFRERKYAQAEAKFEAAWALSKTKGIANNLGEAELQLGKLREAAEHLTIARRLVPPEQKDVRTRIDGLLAQAKGKIGALVIKTNVEGAHVSVDGKAIGDTPLLDPIYVEPASVTIRVYLDGYMSREQSVDVKAGQDVALDLPLDRTAPSLVTADPTVSATPPPPPAPRYNVPAIVAFGVGGAGLVLGAITGGVSLAQYGDVKNTCGNDSICPDARRGDVDTGKALAHVSTVGFILAGVGAAAGATLLLLPIGTKASAQTNLAVGAGTLAIKGSF